LPTDFCKESECFCLPSVAMVLWATIKSTFTTVEIDRITPGKRPLSPGMILGWCNWANPATLTPRRSESARSHGQPILAFPSGHHRRGGVRRHRRQIAHCREVHAAFEQQTTPWREYLAAGETESNLTEIRRCTHTGRPLGSAEFVQALEGSMKRRLAPRNGGSPPKSRPGCETERTGLWPRMSPAYYLEFVASVVAIPGTSCHQVVSAGDRPV
jgi:hypothetical protein